MLSVLLLCLYQSCFCFFTVFAQTALYAVLHWLSVICSTGVASPHCVLSHWSHDFTVWVTCSPKTPRLRQRKSWCFPTVLSSGSLLCCTVTHASSHMLFEHAKKHFRTDSQVRVSAALLCECCTGNTRAHCTHRLCVGKNIFHAAWETDPTVVW